MADAYDARGRATELAESISRLVIVEIDGVPREPTTHLPPGPIAVAEIEGALRAAHREGRAAGLAEAASHAKTHAQIRRYNPPEVAAELKPLPEFLEEQAEEVRRG